MESIICDISGTHTRVGLVREGEILKIRDYLTQDIESVSNLLSMYLYLEKLETKNIVLSIAGKVDSTSGILNHGNLSVREFDLRNIGFEHIIIRNDFVALSYGVSDVKEFKDVSLLKNEEKYLVIGAGTGLGVCLFENDVSKNREEGHERIESIKSKLTMKELDFLENNLNIVEFDDLLSGEGLKKLYTYIAGSKLTAEEISSINNKSSQETFTMFYSFYIKTIIYFIEKYKVEQVYVAGGIIMKNMHYFTEEIENQWKENLGDIGCRILLNYDVSLFGLRNLALRNFK